MAPITLMRTLLEFDLCLIGIWTDLDSTGETPWVKLIVDKYHETAKANGAIVGLPRTRKLFQNINLI